MLKFIISAFKPVCNHKNGGNGLSLWVRKTTIHGDMITALDGKRSLWKCSGCGKYVFSKELNKLETK